VNLPRQRSKAGAAPYRLHHDVPETAVTAPITLEALTEECHGSDARDASFSPALPA
jgi:hypothetical protein